MYTIPENSEGYTAETVTDDSITSNVSLNKYITRTNLIYILIIAVIIIGIFMFFYGR